MAVLRTFSLRLVIAEGKARERVLQENENGGNGKHRKHVAEGKARERVLISSKRRHWMSKQLLIVDLLIQCLLWLLALLLIICADRVLVLFV